MNRISSLFNIKYPIIQAGMIWCSGWRLASAVSNAGGLGLIGSGSMYPDTLEEHLIKCKAATDKPFGVNIPLIYPQVDQHFDLLRKYDVKIVFTSAGNPAKWTQKLKDEGFTVVHVVANTKSAKKCEDAGVDAIVAEGFEAGGHNGKEETTTLTLIPMVREVTGMPLIAAGGIASGKAMLAAMVLGADGVQIGSRFVASEESSAHEAFKQKILETGDGETLLSLKNVIPVRLIRNKFFHEIHALENQGASVDILKEKLGHGRAKKGMFEGDLDEGELEIGQIAATIHQVKPAALILQEIVEEYESRRIEIQKENII